MRTTLLSASFFVLLAACSTSVPDASTSNSDLTSEITPFTSADAPEEYGARVRVAFDDGAPQENRMTASKAMEPIALRFAVGVGVSPARLGVYLYFGAEGEKRPAVGTYSCADGTAQIFEAEWNPDGTAKPARNAATCSLIIDAIEAGPSPSYARTYGRFEATAAAPDGLSIPVHGAFVADFPIDR